MKTLYTIIHARSDRRNKYTNTIVQLHKVKLLRYNPLYKDMEHYGAMHHHVKFKPNGAPYYTMETNLTHLVPYTNVHRSKDWQLLALEYKDQL